MTNDKILSKPKILCVDDEIEITTALTRLLNSDFIVLTASSVDEAKRVIENHSDVAIVLTDFRLARESGLEVLSFTREKRPDAVRALLTGHIEFDELHKLMNQQLAHRLILKPWEPTYLRLQMIESLNSHDTFKQKSELERLAMTDPVTLLRNHRFFQDQLKVEVARALRHDRDLSLLMIDIDHFKNFNDTHGHPAGDRLLRDLSLRLTETVRNLDLVARYGGEEFAILLPDTSLEQATVVAERLRRKICDTAFEIESHSTFVTISLGLATCPTLTTDSKRLVEAADRALYRAKGQGRNQSIVATERDL